MFSRAGDVGLDVGAGRVVAVRDPDQRGEVEDRVAAGHRVADAARVADVARRHLDRAVRIGEVARQVALLRVRLVVHEGADPRAPRDEQVDQGRADEALGSGDEDGAVRCQVFMQVCSWLLVEADAGDRRTSAASSSAARACGPGSAAPAIAASRGRDRRAGGR